MACTGDTDARLASTPEDAQNAAAASTADTRIRPETDHEQAGHVFRFEDTAA